MTLRQARKRARLSQVALGRAANVDQAAISKLELGRVTRPTFDTICRLAAALDIDPRLLKFGDDDQAVAS